MLSVRTIFTVFSSDKFVVLSVILDCVSELLHPSVSKLVAINKLLPRLDSAFFLLALSFAIFLMSDLVAISKVWIPVKPSLQIKQRLEDIFFSSFNQ